MHLPTVPVLTNRRISTIIVRKNTADDLTGNK